MAAQKKEKETDYVLVSFEVTDECYFNILRVCLAEHITLDQFAERAIKNKLKELKDAKKNSKKVRK